MAVSSEAAIFHFARRDQATETAARLVVNAIGAMGIRAAEWWTPASPHSIEEIAETYAGFAVKILS